MKGKERLEANGMGVIATVEDWLLVDAMVFSIVYSLIGSTPALSLPEN